MADYDVSLSANYLLRLSVTQSSQDITNNTSTVSWSLTIYKLAGSGYYIYSSDSWSSSINGNGYGGSFTYDFRSYSSLTIGSGSTVVPHNADGTKQIYSSGTFNDTQANIGAGTAGGYLTLTTIPRASTPTFELVSNPGVLVTTAQSGVAIKINMNRASSSFTHTVRYQMGSAGPTTIDTGVTTNVSSWTIPLSLMNQIPNNTSGLLSIIVQTYSGATLIGSKTVTITMTVPSSIIPDFTTITDSEATVGLAANVGAYVQSLSKLNLAITGAAGAYGSTISSYKIELTGTTINASSGVSNVVSTSGTVTITGTITDSRGRVKVKTVNITVLAYVPPVITSATFERALVAGTPDDNGTYIRVNLNAAVQDLTVAAVQKNELVYKIYTRAHGPGAWTLKTTSALSSGTITFNSYDLVSTYSIASSWDVRVEVLDDFNTSSVEGTVATATIFMHWDAALGVGIGKYRELGALDVIGGVDGGIYQDGYPVVDFNDAATSSAPGIVELATNAETQTGTDTTRAVTPAALAARTATTSRAGVVELATLAEARTGTDTARAITPEGAAAVHALGQVPSSVVVGSGSATVADDGTVTFTGASSVSLNNVFDATGADLYEVYIRYTATGTNGAGFRLRSSGGSDSATNNYDTQRAWDNDVLVQAVQSLAGNTGIFVVTSFGATGYTLLGRLLLSGPALSAPTPMLGYGIATPNPMNTASGTGTFRNSLLHRQSSAFTGISFICGASTTIAGTIKVVKVA